MCTQKDKRKYLWYAFLFFISIQNKHPNNFSGPLALKLAQNIFLSGCLGAVVLDEVIQFCIVSRPVIYIHALQNEIHLKLIIFLSSTVHCVYLGAMWKRFVFTTDFSIFLYRLCDKNTNACRGIIVDTCRRHISSKVYICFLCIYCTVYDIYFVTVLSFSSTSSSSHCWSFTSVFISFQDVTDCWLSYLHFRRKLSNAQSTMFLESYNDCTHPGSDIHFKKEVNIPSEPTIM